MIHSEEEELSPHAHECASSTVQIEEHTRQSLNRKIDYQGRRKHYYVELCIPVKKEIYEE